MRFTWRTVSDVLSDKELKSALGGDGYGEGYGEFNCCYEGTIIFQGSQKWEYDRTCYVKQSYCDGIEADPDFNTKDWKCGPNV